MAALQRVSARPICPASGAQSALTLIALLAVIYRFKSPSSADLIVLESVGEQLLRAMGKEPSPRGILEVSALTSALDALEEAVALSDAQRAATTVLGTTDRSDIDRNADRFLGDPDRADSPQAVGLRQRAWPLQQMLRRALVASEPVVWGV